MIIKGSIILPVYNESSSLMELIEEIKCNIENLDIEFKIILIDDGSTDNSWDIIYNLKKSNNFEFLKIKLSRNFGHQAAIFAGIEKANGDFAIIMDSDFQDDPKYIPELISKWNEDFKIVLARKIARKDKFFRRNLTKLYFKIQNKVSDSSIPPNVGHYSLIDKVVIDQINKMPEKYKFLLGLRSYLGFKTTYINVTKNSRKYGKSKMSILELFKLSLNGLIGFSSLPLNIIGFFGILISIGSLTFSFYTLILNLFFDIKILSWNFGLTSIYFLSGIQLLAISIIGQYISKIFNEVNGRPSYIIEEIYENKE